ncbi:hypothetical protein F8M41_020529 [Gigaspora margarita]|uniref:Uncharacterized protein n=1 Tax=Gigaspora margarita TaxID=4874 RepID=A0A8H4EJS0_GIGMA|nr:hypothetical protein F8M41_020529 [Gigaspora margarita]
MIQEFFSYIECVPQSNQSGFAWVQFSILPATFIREDKSNSRYLNIKIPTLIDSICYFRSFSIFLLILFGLDLVAPWSLVQKSFKNKFKKSLLPFVMNLQPDMHETDKDANFLDQKGEKFNLFYEEYVIGASLLDFIKVDSSCVHE